MAAPHNFTSTRQAFLGLDLNISRTESERLSRYQQFWDFYLGKHWKVAPQDGEPQVTFNYTKLIVDMGWYYLFNKPPKISRRTLDKESKDETARILEFLRDVWTVHNDRDVLLMDMAIIGGITGDAFMVVSAEETDHNTGQTLPAEEKRITIDLHDSSLTFPKFKRKPFGELVQVELWHPWVVTPQDAMKGEIPRTDPTLDEKPPQSEEVHVFREIITEETIREYVDEYEITRPMNVYGEWFAGSRPNPLKKINVVHIQNVRIPMEYYGMSDIYDQIRLNREMNTQMSEVSDILNYHASPITVVKGARVSELQRGSHKVWGGIPPDGAIENLEMKSDLAGSHQFFSETRLAMLETSRTPEVATGRQFPASNLSGTALSMLYGPILEKVGRKSPSYVRGLRRINELVLRIAELKDPFKGEVGKISRKGLRKYYTDVMIQPSIPRNEKEQLDIAQQKLMLHLISRRRLWDEMGVDDVEALEEEIDKEVEEGKLAPYPGQDPAADAGKNPPPSSRDSEPPKNPKPGPGRPRQKSGGSNE